MTKNRIRHLRMAKGLSQEALGLLVHSTKHRISRLESGDTKLDVQTADAIAVALGVSLDEVLGLSSVRNGMTAPGFADSADPYLPEPGDPIAALIGDHRYSYTINSDALELIGIRRGDIVIVDDSAAAVAAVKPLQAVLVNWRSEADSKSYLLPRQYVPPQLAITNSTRNEKTLLLDGDTHIFAVCVAQHRRLT